MPDGKPRPLKYRELRKKLKKFGVIEDPHCRGKESERVLIRPRSPGEMKGPQYPVKHHREGCEISTPVIVALLRRFGIRPDEFWGISPGTPCTLKRRAEGDLFFGGDVSIIEPVRKLGGD